MKPLTLMAGARVLDSRRLAQRIKRVTRLQNAQVRAATSAGWPEFDYFAIFCVFVRDREKSASAEVAGESRTSRRALHGHYRSILIPTADKCKRLALRMEMKESTLDSMQNAGCERPLTSSTEDDGARQWGTLAVRNHRAEPASGVGDRDKKYWTIGG